VNEDSILIEPTHFSSQEDKISGEPALREEEAEQPIKLQARKAFAQEWSFIPDKGSLFSQIYSRKRLNDDFILEENKSR
jgi:hypothetical protein